MSVESWLAEFYSVPAGQVSEADAAAHSLRKWEGLRKENLDVHGMHVSETPWVVVDDVTGHVFAVASDTCALCEVYFDDANGDHPCDLCPLCQVRDGKACDRDRDDESLSPWHAWTTSRNPEPMILWLRKAVR